MNSMKRDDLLQSLKSTFEKQLLLLMDLCDPASEIERIFLLKIIEYCLKRPDRFYVRYLFDSDSNSPNIQLPDNYGRIYGIEIKWYDLETSFEIIPQFELQTEHDFPETHRYKLDFAFIVRGENSNQPARTYCIECDGFKYHQTLEQLKKDNKRSRSFNFKGISTLRFTGSEIFNLTENDVGEFLMSFIISRSSGNTK